MKVWELNNIHINYLKKKQSKILMNCIPLKLKQMVTVDIIY